LNDDKDRDFILHGLRYGFDIIDDFPVGEHIECDNYASARGPENRDKVEQAIIEEIDSGHYCVTSNKPHIVSAIGAIPKPGGSDIRIIHDASRPAGKSMNELALAKNCQYTSIDKVVEVLQPKGWLAKIDLRHAYRSVPIAKSNYCATGLKWKFSSVDNVVYMFDTRLPFGAKKSPHIFQTITESITRMMQKRGYTVMVYLDDFIIVEECRENCEKAYAVLLSLLQNLGFVISWNKIGPPSQRLVYLGITIDSVKGELAVPEDKLLLLKSEVEKWGNKQSVSKRELQQFIGRLTWASKLLRTSRPYLRRLIDLTCKLKRPMHRIRLSKCVKQDLQMLAVICERFNGTVLFKDTLPSHALSTDACTTGGAGFFMGDWFYSNWALDSPGFELEHINVKEVYAVLLAAKRWCVYWRNKNVTVYVDNMVSLFAINKGTSKNARILGFIKELYVLSITHNFHVTAKYINTKDNVVADALSRLDNSEFVLVAAELLLEWNVLILYPGYDLHQNMSDGCVNYILQTMSALKRDIWILMSQGTDEPCILTTQSPHTVLSCVPSLDFVCTLDTRWSPVIPEHYVGTQYF
jgi:hypothetical protein